MRPRWEADTVIAAICVLVGMILVGYFVIRLWGLHGFRSM